MPENSLGLLGSLAVLSAALGSIHFSRDLRLTRAQFAVRAAIAIGLSLLGIALSDKVSPILYALFIAGWLMLMNSVARRFNDFGADRWKAGWGLFPIALPVVLLICLAKPTNQNLEPPEA